MKESGNNLIVALRQKSTIDAKVNMHDATKNGLNKLTVSLFFECRSLRFSF